MAKSKETIEIFIREYIKQDNASAAFRVAFPAKALKWKPKVIHEKACVLLGSEKVQERLSEINQQLSQKTLMTAEQAFDKYEVIYSKGLNIKQLNASKGAVDSQAKLCGLLVDKTENINKNEAVMSAQDEQILYRYLKNKYGVDE